MPQVVHRSYKLGEPIVYLAEAVVRVAGGLPQGVGAGERVAGAVRVCGGGTVAVGVIYSP